MKKYRLEFLSGNASAARAAIDNRDTERYIYVVTRTDGGERHVELQGYRGSLSALVWEHLGAGEYELEFPFFDLKLTVEEFDIDDEQHNPGGEGGDAE